MTPEAHGPRGELLSSEAYRTSVAAAARDALAVIDGYLRGEIDGVRACRSIVNDEYLREIVPIGLLLGFIGVESQFAADTDEDEDSDPIALADRRAERDEFLAAEAESLTRDCHALAAHLGRWQLERAAGSSP